MLLTFGFDQPFTPLAMHPALVPGEFFQLGRVFLLELGVGVSRLIQDAIERLHFPPGLRFLLSRLSCLLLGSGDLLLKLLGLLVRRQQQPAAFLGIVGQSGRVIHNAHCYNNDQPARTVVSSRINPLVDTDCADVPYSARDRRAT